ncbi:hypothetical protein [Streptomyces sp. NPDC060184]|uniref:hypothetical protein n=1 Tax=Streptomyces sp. NPDC060184 TaxID=3347064 RepID=UPI00365F5B1D
MIPRRFTIALPTGMRLLNVNEKLHHRPKAEYVKALRGAAMLQCSENPAMRAALAAANPGPVLDHAYILGIIHPATRRRADPANWYPSFKAAVDGLVDAGVLEDDDHLHLVGPDMRLGPVVRGGQIVLHIEELTPERHAAFQWADRVIAS